MSRSTPALLRIDPELLPLWRDGDTLQFGLHGDVRVQASEPWIESVVSRLREGIPENSYDLVAHGFGAPIGEARALLKRLRPVLSAERPAPAVHVETLNLADSRIAGWMRDALDDYGLPSARAGDPGSVAVVMAHGAVAALQLQRWLNSDANHLPVAFDAGGAEVGPLVVPGRTPCLACRDAHERQRDPAWPLLHSQRVGRTDSPVPHTLVTETARLIDRLLRDDDPGGRIGVVSPDGRRTWRAVRFHAECRCRETSFRSPPGTATAPALRARPPETRTA